MKLPALRLPPIWTVVAAALLLRVLVIAAAGLTAAPRYGDTYVYHTLANRLAHSPAEWLAPGSECGYRPPLTFLVYALAYRPWSEAPYWYGQLVTAALGVAVALGCFTLADRAFGRRAAWYALVWRAFAPSWLISDTVVMSEPLFGLIELTLVSAALARDWSGRRSFALGVLVALAILTREPAIVLAPLLFPPFWCAGPPRAIWRLTLLFSLGIAVTLGPWLIRNQQVWGQPLPLSQTLGPNFQIGASERANGTYVEVQDLRPAELRFGSPAASRWHLQSGLAWVADHPARWLALMPKKLAYFSAPTFNRDELRFAFGLSDRSSTWLSLLSGGSSALLLLLGVVALGQLPRSRLKRITLWLLAIGLLSAGFFFSMPRYRDGVDLLLVVLAAGWLADSARPRWRVGQVGEQARALLPLVPLLLLWTVWFVLKGA